MCVIKQDAKSKMDHLIKSMDRMSASMDALIAELRAAQNNAILSPSQKRS